MNLAKLFPWEPGMNYMAVDESGRVFQYEKEPVKKMNIVWGTESPDDKYEWVGDVDLPQDVKWYDTLVERKSETPHFTPTNDQLDLLINVAERHILSFDLTSITREGILAVISMYEQFKNE